MSKNIYLNEDRLRVLVGEVLSLFILTGNIQLMCDLSARKPFGFSRRIMPSDYDSPLVRSMTFITSSIEEIEVDTEVFDLAEIIDSYFPNVARYIQLMMMSTLETSQRSRKIMTEILKDLLLVLHKDKCFQLVGFECLYDKFPYEALAEIVKKRISKFERVSSLKHYRNNNQ